MGSHSIIPTLLILRLYHSFCQVFCQNFGQFLNVPTITLKALKFSHFHTPKKVKKIDFSLFFLCFYRRFLLSLQRLQTLSKITLYKLGFWRYHHIMSCKALLDCQHISPKASSSRKTTIPKKLGTSGYSDQACCSADML